MFFETQLFFLKKHFLGCCKLLVSFQSSKSWFWKVLLMFLLFYGKANFGSLSAILEGKLLHNNFFMEKCKRPLWEKWKVGEWLKTSRPMILANLDWTTGVEWEETEGHDISFVKNFADCYNSKALPDPCNNHLL